MISEPPEYDPIAIWQNQQKHVPPSFQDILMRARRFEARNRRGVLIFSTALILHIAVSIVEDLSGTKSRIWWVGSIRFALMSVWIYFLPFSKSRTDGSSTLFLRGAANTPVLDFYRRQLRRRIDYFQDSLVRKVQIAALLVSFVLYSIFYPPLFLVSGVPFAILTILFYKRRLRELPAIQDELDVVNRFIKGQ